MPYVSLVASRSGLLLILSRRPDPDVLDRATLEHPAKVDLAALFTLSAVAAIDEDRALPGADKLAVQHELRRVLRKRPLPRRAHRACVPSWLPRFPLLAAPCRPKPVHSTGALDGALDRRTRPVRALGARSAPLAVSLLHTPSRRPKRNTQVGGGAPCGTRRPARPARRRWHARAPDALPHEGDEALLHLPSVRDIVRRAAGSARPPRGAAWRRGRRRQRPTPQGRPATKRVPTPAARAPLLHTSGAERARRRRRAAASRSRRDAGRR